MVALFFLFPSTSVANGYDHSRVDVGLEFFSSFLAADSDIAQKTNSQNHLVLAILYQGNLGLAQRLAEHLLRIRRIRGLTIRVVLTDDPDLGAFENFPPAGLFLAQPRPLDLDRIIDWGRIHHRIVVSPFSGDVARGILGGISVREVVLPEVNMAALKLWNVRLKSFFLGIARRYGED